jgi:hypothetical protein
MTYACAAAGAGSGFEQLAADDDLTPANLNPPAHNVSEEDF